MSGGTTPAGARPLWGEVVARLCPDPSRRPRGPTSSVVGHSLPVLRQDVPDRGARLLLGLRTCGRGALGVPGEGLDVALALVGVPARLDVRGVGAVDAAGVPRPVGLVLLALVTPDDLPDGASCSRLVWPWPHEAGTTRDGKCWSGWPDSNRRPLAPKASALPSCATPRVPRPQLTVAARCGRLGGRRWPMPEGHTLHRLARDQQRAVRRHGRARRAARRAASPSAPRASTATCCTAPRPTASTCSTATPSRTATRADPARPPRPVRQVQHRPRRAARAARRAAAAAGQRRGRGRTCAAPSPASW